MSVCVFVAAMAIVAVGCGTETSNSEGQDSTDATVPEADLLPINQVLRTDDRFSTLVTGIDSTGLDSLLAGEKDYTLFAPPDTAFRALPEGTVALLLSDRRERLRTILDHHIVPGRVGRAELADSTVLTTLGGDSLRVRSTDDGVRVGAARIVEGDVEGSNGLIHVVDRVLQPPAEDK